MNRKWTQMHADKTKKILTGFYPEGTEDIHSIDRGHGNDRLAIILVGSISAFDFYPRASASIRGSVILIRL